MKKRLQLLLTICASALVLGGCGENAIPDLSEEEMHQVEEYAANLLLSYDKNYKKTLISEEEMAAEEEKLEKRAQLQKELEEQKQREEELKAEEEAKKAEEEANSSSTVTSTSENLNTDIDEFLELTNVNIEYAGYLICDSYPEATSPDDWQGVTKATGNNKLVVFTYQVTNVTGEDTYFDMASVDAKVTFKVNGTATKSALTTLLLNDFLHYRGTIPAGETVDFVMLMELPASDAESLTGIVMNIKYNGQTGKTTLF